MYGHKVIPSRLGGVEIVVEELSTRMVEKGFNVTCVNRRTNDYPKAISNYKGVVIEDVITINKKGLAAVSSSFFAAIKAAFSNCDIVHIHAEGPAAFTWIVKLFKKKVVVTIHGLDHQRAKWGRFASFYIMLGEKSAVKYADKIIVLSNNIQRYFKEKYDRDTVFIPNGVNVVNTVKANTIKELWNLNKNLFVLYVGRLVPEKGLEYLLNAWKDIRTEKKLIIAGGSSDSDEFVNYIKRIASNNVIFTGHLEKNILEELYSNAYLYILPSDLEGMPLSLLEAMSYGNCCLTSDIDECVEVIENKGVTFKHGNVTDLKEKLQYLLDNESIVKKYKIMSSSFILRKYNWDKIVDKTLELYKQI